MLPRFVSVDRETPSFLPPSVQEWVPEGHLARFVVDIVDRLNLRRIEQTYAGRGSAAYHPSMLTALIFYGYCTRIFSSRKLEAATYDSIPVRYICANTHPDHDTIADFRRRFSNELRDAFVQVLLIAHEMGLLKLGAFAIDGTKVHANASKHKALSYGHAQKLEAQLRQEIAELQRLSEEADRSDNALELDVPAEIERRELRLRAIADAKQRIEQRAAERDAAQSSSPRKGSTDDSPDEPPSSSPSEPVATPRAKDQVNLTDEQSRIMPQSGGGFEQCYNAQAAVDVNSKIVIASFVTQDANDKQQLAPSIEQVKTLPAELGYAETVLADNGFFSKENVQLADAATIKPMIALGREQHNVALAERLMPEPPEPDEDDPLVQMRYRMRTKEGRELYAKRKSTVEPVFGIIKHAMGFRQFLRRGLAAANAEWTLVTLAYNIKRIFALTIA